MEIEWFEMSQLLLMNFKWILILTFGIAEDFARLALKMREKFTRCNLQSLSKCIET
jgi:hypothetical protein